MGRPTTGARSTFLRDLAQRIARQGERLAVDDGERRYTYAELDREANRVAQAILARRGAAAEVVAVMLGHTAGAVAALLGTVKAGKIRLAIEPRTPAARLREILAHAGATLLIAAPGLGASRTALGGVEVLEWDHPAADAADAEPRVDLGDDDLAAIYYTSGSTGRPKGVVIGHGEAGAGARSTDCGVQITPDDRVGVVSDFSFAVSRAADMALLHGASVHLYDARAGGPRGLALWLRAARISFVTMMASTLRALLDEPTEAVTLPDLRVLSVAGEPVFAADVRRVRERLADTALFAYNYASTETMVVTANVLAASAELGDGPLPVGRPLEGVDVELADVGEGGVGEIVVRSRAVARGYWRDPGSTAAVFGPVRAPARSPMRRHSFGQKSSRTDQIRQDCITDAPGDGRRSFRTGDLGRFREDGMLEIVGRLDWRLKVRGYRVDPGEAERALLQLDDVARAAVVGVTRGGSTRLVAHVVPAPGCRPTVNRLRGALLQTLPPYAVPASYLLVDALPLTATGKVDRLLLPKPPATRPLLDEAYAEPRDEWERMIVAIWEDVLDTRPIGIDDNFYALGGDSLAAAQAVAALEVRLRQPLPLLLLAESNATPAAVARLVRDRSGSVFSGAVPLQPLGSRPPFFCVGGADGEVLDLAPLAAALAPEQPFVALPGAHGPGWGRGVAAAAADHLRRITAMQGQASLRLGGYSAGGVTAFEMARQLLAAGTPPALVVLLDSPTPEVAVAQRRRLTLRERMGLGTRLRGVLFRVATTVGLAPSVAWRRDARFEAATRAVRAYHPGPYAGRVVLMRTNEHAPELPYDLGWGRLATQLEIVEIPGDHRSMLHPPHVQKLSEVLRRALADATDREGRAERCAGAGGRAACAAAASREDKDLARQP